MLIEKNGEAIRSLEQWRRIAPPKSPDQWVEGRSAFELARAWCGSGAAEIPEGIRSLLDSRTETRGLCIDRVTPECRIRFDNRGGEPRNADLAFLGRSAESVVAVTIEAKADEPFGATVSDTLIDALERHIKNPRSRGMARTEQLVSALFRSRGEDQPRLGGLRYQLLTATAGTLAYAVQQEARIGVLVLHEFITDKTRDEFHARNNQDYRNFIHRLSSTLPDENDLHALLGPFMVPGNPLFTGPPALLIGKTVTNRRVLRRRTTPS